MITMRIKGGLGNQLFQYAVAYALSKRLNQPFQFDPTTSTMATWGYKLPELNVDVDDVVKDNELPPIISVIKNAFVNKVFRILNISKHKCNDYLYWIETRDEWQPEFFTIDASNIYVDGYFQSEEYFKQFRDDLLRQYRPRYEAEEPFLEIFEQINYFNSVGIHVRRGDFNESKHPFHYLLGETYYKKAIEYIRVHVENPVFFWFSNDFNWVRTHIREEPDFRFVNIKTSHGDIDDMMLMKSCRHIVTANSTFSWWAAWLNEHENAIRVVPQKPYGMDGMIPDGWVKL